MGKEDWVDHFVGHLEELRDGENRGALASLRRGLGGSPGSVPMMYPYILPWSPANRRAEDACYVIASLFALHPQKGGKGTIGKSLSMIRDPRHSLEKRFIALLNCHPNDLPHHLRQAVSLLKAKDIPVDWQQLLRDTLHWDHESHFVQQRWAREFWQGNVQQTQEETKRNSTI